MCFVTDRDVTQVGALVATRRGELGLTQQELADAANVAVGTVVALESGRRWPQAAKRSAIERALRWASGDLVRLRNGGTATSLPQRVDLGHGITVDVDEETDPEALRRSLALALNEDITWEDAMDKLDAIADLHGELRAILRKLRPPNGG
jgi:transcriptional regulator with XRE-family HTH domain